ncbi:MAG: Methyl-accepting transducer protein [Patescibacteria group bacterium]|nr:Methyl-accepting transducer protein [Patescibacteria group bacterium]
MKLVETKIYLKFILWFLAVALLPLVVLLGSFAVSDQYRSFFQMGMLPANIMIGIFVSLALVLGLSLLATRSLSKNITAPVQASVNELSKVVNLLLNSIQGLSDISQTNNQISQFLTSSSQQQQNGLKAGSQALSKMVRSLVEITHKTGAANSSVDKANKLAEEGKAQSENALASLAAVKNLLTDTQKLSQALDQYAQQVAEIAKRVEVVAETTKFFSLNMSIEAKKASYSEEFNGLVTQIRDLNNISEQAASSIQSLAKDMSRQIDQSKQSAVYEWQETNKSINVVTQTLSFLTKIISNIDSIAHDIQVINKETTKTYEDADQVNKVISNISQQSKLLVKQTDDITKVIGEQLVVTRSLNKSSVALNKVTDTLSDLVGKN